MPPSVLVPMLEPEDEGPPPIETHGVSCFEDSLLLSEDDCSGGG
jgi:hypothetical protein